jgi:hypothetical protein
MRCDQHEPTALRPDLREVEHPKSGSDLAISAHLTTEAEIDEFVDDALAGGRNRVAAKGAWPARRSIVAEQFKRLLQNHLHANLI